MNENFSTRRLEDGCVDEFVYRKVARVKSGGREVSLLPKPMVMESRKMMAEICSVEFSIDKYYCPKKAV